MQTIFHPSLGRGLTSTPWLVSRHSFSFNEWYNPEKVQFGALRVLNDDLILPGQGFPPHSHSDMEIVTIPLKGVVAHKDSTGGEGTVRAGEVQIMSAGTGVTHSEFNASATESLELLQIWVLPERPGLPARYQEKKFDMSLRNASWQLLVSPQEESSSLQIFQRAWFSIVRLERLQSISYALHSPENGVYFFVVQGKVRVGGVELGRRDALGVRDTESVELEVIETAEVLAIEVPV